MKDLSRPGQIYKDLDKPPVLKINFSIFPNSKPRHIDQLRKIASNSAAKYFYKSKVCNNNYQNPYKRSTSVTQKHSYLDFVKPINSQEEYPIEYLVRPKLNFEPQMQKFIEYTAKTIPVHKPKDFIYPKPNEHKNIEPVNWNALKTPTYKNIKNMIISSNTKNNTRNNELKKIKNLSFAYNFQEKPENINTELRMSPYAKMLFKKVENIGQDLSQNDIQNFNKTADNLELEENESQEIQEEYGVYNEESIRKSKRIYSNNYENVSYQDKLPRINVLEINNFPKTPSNYSENTEDLLVEMPESHEKFGKPKIKLHFADYKPKFFKKPEEFVYENMENLKLKRKSHIENMDNSSNISDSLENISMLIPHTID